MKWKRALSLTLTLSMLASTLPAPAMAAGESNTAEGYTDPWKADAAITTKAAKDAITSPTFTGKEWTGTDGNEDVFAINREEASTFSTSGVIYDSVKAALKSAINFDKDASGYVQFLTGENQADWSLRVVKNDTIAKESYADFYKTDYTPDNAWSTNLQLPASWTYWNLDYPIYTNTQVPWQEDNTSSDTAPAAPVNYNPVGMYRKTFTLDKSLQALKEQNGRIYINFQGVEAAYYVYLNGQAVGYSEDTYSPHSFDITDYLVDGENLLAVEVHKFCDGTWFELQDMFKDGGIFRDVYVYGATQVHIDDYFVTTDLDETYENANLNLAVTVENESAEAVNGYKLDVRVYNEDGTMFVNGVTADVPAIEANGEQTVDISKYVQNPELWSAETPNLYYLVVSLYEEGGAYLGSMSQQLGFREIEFTRTEVDSNGNRTTQDSEYQPITINGQPLVFRGTNRHDTDPVYGKYVSHEVQEADVVLMKQYNINAIRTSHYSNDDYLYYLCNKYGLYMMGETNLESHQLMNNEAKEVLFKELAMDRTVTAFNRLKNVSAIVAWSTGNENYYKSNANYADYMFYNLIWYFKDHDTTRPVHSESSNDANGTDMGSNMYPSVDTVQSWATSRNMPYVMCEYDHAMGNAVGSIKEYWDAVRSGDNMLGGFIWDWVDQARTTVYPTSYELGDFPGSVVTAERINDNPGEGALAGNSLVNGSVGFADPDGVYNAALSGSGKAFTVEIILKPTEFKANEIFAAKGDKQFALKLNGDSDLEFFVYNGSWNSLVVEKSKLGDDFLNNWHQLAATYDNGEMKVYLDGELLGSKSGPTSISSSGALLSLGYQSDYSGRQFIGELSLGRFYNVALTQEEIKAQNSATPAIGKDDDCVLLWADMSSVRENKDGSYNYYVQDYAYYNSDLYDSSEIDGQFFGYGGDTGDYRNNSGNFCQNGLVTPDRVAQPELYEVKYQYQSFWFTADEADLLRGAITVENENGFVNLNDYDVTWQLMENGTELASGTVDASVAPQETKQINVPYMDAMAKVDVKEGAEYYLNIVVSLKNDTLWADAGHEVAHEQFQVPANVNQVTYTPSSDGVTVDKETDPDVITVTGTDFSFNIDKTSGAISNYVYGGETLLKEGPVPNFWRAPVNNDNGNFDWSWQNAGKNAAIDGEISVGKDDANRTTISFTLTFPNMAGLTETMTYTVEGNGAVTLDTTVDGTQTKTGKGRFMRIGTTMTLPAGYENVTWYGNGPVEAMWDRESFAMVGEYRSTVNELFFPYLDTEDTGTLTGVKWFTVTSDKSDVALAIAAEDAVEAQALHFTADDLTQARHPYELTYEDETFLSINYRSQGTGNASCGPDVLGQYTLPTSQTYTYSYTMVPYTVAGANLYDVTAPYRTASVVSEDAAVEALKAQINGLVVTSADQLDEAKALLKSYNALPDDLKTQMGENALNHLNEQIAIAEKMATDPYYHAVVEDQSANGFDVDLTEKADTVTMKMDDKQGAYLTGHFLVDNEGAKEAMNDVIGGTNSFTLEAVIRPNVYTTDGSSFNMIMGKGDKCMAFRISGGNLYFFTYNGSNWMPTPSDGETSNFPMNQERVQQWLRVAAVYDGETDGGTLSVYLNGDLSSTRKNVGQVTPSDLYLGIGMCPDTGRTSMSDFSSVRVYASALDAAALKADDETNLAREDVALWYDFNQINYTTAIEVEVKEELPAYTYLGVEPTLPDAISVSVNGGEPSDMAITWNLENLNLTKVGSYEISGVLDNGKAVKHTISVVPDDVVYFVDAGAAEFTALGQTMVDANADTIQNASADQAYTAENGWGYLNGDDLGTDNGTSGSAYATLRHMTKEATGKSLSYQFDGLTAGTYNIYIGYYDPWTQWSTTRPATITLNQGDAALATLTGVDLCSAQPKYVTMENVEVADGAVTLTLAPEKTGDSNYDVLVSYIVITRVDGEEPEPETYTVTVDTEGNGTASADVKTAKEGDTITLTKEAADGWHFVEWQSDNVTVKDDSFTMPAANVTVTAVFEQDEHVHTLTKTEAKDPTCTGDGNIAFWYCQGCQKYFSDEEGNVKITQEETVVKALGHEFAAEWSKDETGHWHKCIRCDEIDEVQAHTPDRDAPTETEPQLCTVCGYVMAPATGHITHTPSADWSYDENQHWHKCTGCEEKLDVANHSGGTATCTEQAICEVCGQPYGALSAHSYTEWKFDNTQHWKVCADCGAEEPESRTGHDWKLESESETEQHYTCVCGATKTEEIPVEIWIVTFEANNGSKPVIVEVKDGETVTAPPAPTNGDFEFDGWYTNAACTEPYDFDKAVTEDITLYAGWKMVGPSVDHDNDKDEPEEPEEPEEPTDPEEPGTDIEDPDTPLNPTPDFTDVADDFWGKEAIDYVVAEGLMNGTSETTFAPNVTTTRAMLMTILARMDGVDTTGSDPWYQKGMEWAVAEGVSDGTNPEGTITREQLAVMLYRYAGSPESSGTALDCADADQISDWAYMAMHWAVSNGILSGKGNDTLDPQGNATRAEISQMLYNFSKIG